MVCAPHALRAPEEVGDGGEGRALRSLEENRGAVRGDHAPVDLRHLEPGIHLRLDLHELTGLAQAAEEGAEIGGRGAGARHD